MIRRTICVYTWKTDYFATFLLVLTNDYVFLLKE
jgi:hypothetical protein